jgi:hypothetical protein
VGANFRNTNTTVADRLLCFFESVRGDHNLKRERMKQYETYETMARIGREKFRDDNFCTVIAVATVTGISFARARRKMEKVGRKHRCGTYPRQYHDVIKRQGYEMKPCYGILLGRTVNNVVGNLPEKGTFLIRTARHVLAVVDGVINDHTAPEINGGPSKRIVKSIYQVTKEEA